MKKLLSFLVLTILAIVIYTVCINIGMVWKALFSFPIPMLISFLLGGLAKALVDWLFGKEK